MPLVRVEVPPWLDRDFRKGRYGDEVLATACAKSTLMSKLRIHSDCFSCHRSEIQSDPWINVIFEPQSSWTSLEALPSCEFEPSS